MKLISMVDYVLNHPATTDYEWQLSNNLKYANFLTQPLKLEMFVPCDENGDNQRYKETYFTDWKMMHEDKNELIIFNKQINFISFHKNGKIYFDDQEVKTIEDLIQFDLDLDWMPNMNLS